MTQHDVHRREYGIASSALFKPKFRRDRSPAPRGHPVYPVTSPEFKPVFIPRSDDDVKLTEVPRDRRLE
jgi:hypothetical protein